MQHRHILLARKIELLMIMSFYGQANLAVQYGIRCREYRCLPLTELQYQARIAPPSHRRTFRMRNQARPLLGCGYYENYHRRWAESSEVGCAR